MITVPVGRTLLNAYNEKYNKSYSAKEFFDHVYFELFFNNKKYLYWVQNSSFVQELSTSKKGEKGIRETIKDSEGKTIKFNSEDEAETYLETIVKPRTDFLEAKSVKKNGIKILKTLNEDERKIKLEEFHKKVNNAYDNNDIEASVALGFPASESKEFATTSGLVSSVKIEIDIEEIYLSWIGAGLSIGVAGGFSILFDQPDILLKVYDGWKVYRKFLNNPSLEDLAPNKITSWNGQWLNYIYDKYPEPAPDFGTLNEKGVFKATTKGTVINTVKWSQLFFNLSKHFSNKTYTGYLFSFGQRNTTLGFFPFRFSEAKTLIGTYKKLFGKNAVLRDAKKYEQIYGIHIKRACELGAIGIQALEPEGLKEYFKPGKTPSFKKEKNEEKDYEKNIIPFRTYKTWLLAMISKNKEEMVDYTATIAKTLIQCAEAYRKEKKGKTKFSNQIKELLSSSSKRAFIDQLSELIREKEFVNNEQLDVFNELKNRVHLSNSVDFKYLITLIKFDYAFQSRKT